MYVASLKIENFRQFGENEHAVEFVFSPGFNLLVGENDAGKTTVVDALRHLLWTTSQDYHRLTVDDFHVSGAERAETLSISAILRGLTTPEQATFLEYLTTSPGETPHLSVSLTASRLDGGTAAKGRIAVSFRAGALGSGPPIEGTIREFLRTTYLRPLRDAEAELTAGRGSRLSQILASHPEFAGQHVSDYQDGGPPPATLVGIMAQAEALIQANPVVTSVRDTINREFLASLSLAADPLAAAISVARRTDLQQVLEKLELALGSRAGVQLPTRRGLGLNNVLFMATELLLLGAAEGMPLLLIEEPEAHLHPQMQLRLMELLELRSKPGPGRVQVIATTHSPALAAKADIEAITLLADHKAFPLDHKSTALEKADYAFLRRFLDVTKANLFFARSVIIVEGDAENILLPALAEGLGRPLAKYGVSIVNVGHRGLFRYARIFQRTDGTTSPIRVVCLTDRDFPTAASAAYVPPPAPPGPGEAARRKFENDFTVEELEAAVAGLKARDGGSVRTFVSPRWTLEHDIAAAGLGQLSHRAIRMARRAKDKNDVLTDQEIAHQIQTADAEFAGWQAQELASDEIAARIYRSLFDKRASKVEAAHYLAAEIPKQDWEPENLARRLPRYLVEAIEYVTEPIERIEDVI